MTFPAWEAAHTARVVLNETLSAKTISAPSCGQNVARNLAPKCASMQLQILFRWSQAKTTEKKPSRSGVYSYAWSMPSLTPKPGHWFRFCRFSFGTCEVQPHWSRWKMFNANCKEWLETHAAMAALATAFQEKHHQVSTKRNEENCHIQNQKDRKAEDFGFKMSLLFWMLFFDKTLFNEGELEKVWGFWSKELYSHSHALRIPQTNAMQLPPFAHCYTQSCKRSTSPQKRLKHRSSKCFALNLSGYGTKYIYKCSIYISHLLIWTISWWCDLLCTQLSLSCRHDYSLRSGDIQHLFPLIFNGSFFSQVDRTTKTASVHLFAKKQHLCDTSCCRMCRNNTKACCHFSRKLQALMVVLKETFRLQVSLTGCAWLHIQFLGRLRRLPGV